MNVSSFGADVKPFALKGQVAVCDSAREDQGPSQVITGQAFHYLGTQSHQRVTLVLNHAAPSGRSRE